MYILTRFPPLMWSIFFNLVRVFTYITVRQCVCLSFHLPPVALRPQLTLEGISTWAYSRATEVPGTQEYVRSGAMGTPGHCTGTRSMVLELYGDALQWGGGRPVDQSTSRASRGYASTQTQRRLQH